MKRRIQSIQFAVRLHLLPPWQIRFVSPRASSKALSELAGFDVPMQLMEMWALMLGPLQLELYLGY